VACPWNEWLPAKVHLDGSRQGNIHSAMSVTAFVVCVHKTAWILVWTPDFIKHMQEAG
jgi:hypothetical protein